MNYAIKPLTVLILLILLWLSFSANAAKLNVNVNPTTDLVHQAEIITEQLNQEQGHLVILRHNTDHLLAKKTRMAAYFIERYKQTRFR